jgi:hypothetical protein
MKLVGVLIVTLFIIGVFFPKLVLADDGNAGVGVINVPPNYSNIRIIQQDNQIRAYLTISDYNSWLDINTVQVNLEDNGAVLHSFLFQQYEDPENFKQLNTFTEIEGGSLLILDSCDVTHSSSTKTIADRCRIELRFVFKTTYFTELHIISTDRAGDSTEAFIEYKGSDLIRDSNTLLIPWIDGTVKAEFPPYLLDISIFFIAVISTVIIGRKTPIATTLQQVFYESK